MVPAASAASAGAEALQPAASAASAGAEALQPRGEERRLPARDGHYYTEAEFRAWYSRYDRQGLRRHVIAEAMWAEALQREKEDAAQAAAFWAKCMNQIEHVEQLIAEDEDAMLSWKQLVDSFIPGDAPGPWKAGLPSRYYPKLYAPSMLKKFLLRIEQAEELSRLPPYPQECD